MKVKICGITHSQDAEHAARLGADYIGVIFSKFSKRFVELSVAKSIVQAALCYGAQPIGVLVEQTAEEILFICEQTGIFIVQLHGTISKQACSHLPFPTLYAISVNKNGMALEKPPKGVTPLYDHGSGGTGCS